MKTPCRYERMGLRTQTGHALCITHMQHTTHRHNAEPHRALQEFGHIVYVTVHHNGRSSQGEFETTIPYTACCVVDGSLRWHIGPLLSFPAKVTDWE